MRQQIATNRAARDYAEALEGVAAPGLGGALVVVVAEKSEWVVPKHRNE